MNSMNHTEIEQQGISDAFRHYALDNFPKYLQNLENQSFERGDFEGFTKNEKEKLHRLSFYLDIANLMMRGKRIETQNGISPVRPAVYSRYKVPESVDGMSSHFVTASEAFRYFVNKALERANGEINAYPDMRSLEVGLADGSVQKRIYIPESQELMRILRESDQAEYIEDFFTIDDPNKPRTFFTTKKDNKVNTVMADFRMADDLKRIAVTKSNLPLGFHDFVSENKEMLIAAFKRMSDSKDHGDVEMLYDSLIHEAESADWLFDLGPFMMIISSNSVNVSGDLQRTILHASGMVEHIIRWQSTPDGFVDAHGNPIALYAGAEAERVKRSLTRILQFGSGSYTEEFTPDANQLPHLTGKKFLYTTSVTANDLPYGTSTKKMSFGIGIPTNVSKK